MALQSSFSLNESQSLVSELIIKQRDILITDDVLRIYRWVVFTVACTIITLCGIVANIINIVCFTKQGFTDAVSVNFLGLTVSDLGSLLTLLALSICHNPKLQDLDLPFDSMKIINLTTLWPHIGLARVTCLITALITVERCLCITIPLKVKSVMTPKRVLAIIVCIYIVIIASLAPLYFDTELPWTPLHNRTNGRSITYNISHIINNTLVPFVAFVVIIVCTGILVVQLKKKSKCRNESQSVHNSHDMSNRDRKLTKMVVSISIFFIACYCPATMIFVAMIFSQEVNFYGDNFNISIVISGIGFLLEAVNSALNIVIYYRMSRKYRDIFQQIFPNKWNCL